MKTKTKNAEACGATPTGIVRWMRTFLRRTWTAALTFAVAVGLVLGLGSMTARGNTITNFTTIYDTDFVSAGLAGMRNSGAGTLTLAGVSGSVTKAYLYWHGPMNSTTATVNNTVTVDGNTVIGANIGLSSDNCWSFTASQAYRADVTALVAAKGNGAYALTNFIKTTAINNNGVSLLVFFDDGNPANNRDVVVFNGNDSNQSNPYDALGWNVTLSGINYTAGPASIQLHVSDGQQGASWNDANLILNASVLAAGPNVFTGNTLPGAGFNSNGNLWDIRNFDITSYLSPGPNTLTMTTTYLADCFSLIVAVINLPTGAAPPPPINLQLTPKVATNVVGTAHTVCATLFTVSTNGVTNSIVGTTVTFNVTNGPNATVNGTSVTDSNGVACFTYVGAGGVGTDIIDVSFVGTDTNRHSDFSTKVWVTSGNLPPVAKCKNLVVPADANCQGTGSVDDGSFDPDPGDVITVVQTPPGPYSLGTNLVTLLVTDSHGASNTCTAAIIVVDTTGPVINCPTNIVVATDPGQCSAVVNYTVTATDNCAGPTVTVDPSHHWIGFMNVFALPSSGNYPPSLGSYQFGSPWGTADLVAYFTGSVLTLSPNTIGDPDPYWYTPSGGPGSVGNKIMDANMYVEPPAGTLAGINLRFTGTVLANTLVGNVDARTNGWTSVAFIKDFAPDYSSFNTVTAPLVNGVFSITLATVNDPARHVQYGFETIGPDVWVTDVAPFGSIQVGPANTFPRVTCDPPSGSVFPKGTTTVCCTATDAAGNTNACCFTVTVEDREAPVAVCREGVNPSGKKIPVAGKNPSSGQNPDGFYQLLGKDNCDANPAIYVADSGSAFIAGPFANGDVIKLTQSPGRSPGQEPAPAPIVAHVHLKGDGLLYAVDADGNISDAQLCLVPRPPK